MNEQCGREVVRVRRGGAAFRLGMRVGDRLIAVNGKQVADILDVQFYAADGVESLTWLRAGHEQTKSSQTSSAAPLGLEFQHPTFDTEIRKCNNRCAFCFVVQMAPGLRSTLHIKDDDYRYSFLYGHFVTLTNLKSRDWEKIIEQRLSPLYVSVQATESNLRAELLGNPRAGDILERLQFLASAGIEVHAQVVVVPGCNDGIHLRRTVEDLAGLFPHVRTCSVVPVGLTRFHRKGLRVFRPDETQKMIEDVHRWQDAFSRRIGSRFVLLTDEWYLSVQQPVPALHEYEDVDLRENGLGLVRSFLDDWDGAKKRARSFRLKREIKSALLATGILFAPVLEKIALEWQDTVGTAMTVAAVENRRFGTTVTVAGLLTAEDVIHQLGAYPSLPDAVFLPRVMFDHPGALSLDNRTPLDVARALRTTVYLADSMSDIVRAWTTEDAVSVRPTDRNISKRFLKAGGWIE
jgi:putative radical SAM enzyme (TIGR03279 family)